MGQGKPQTEAAERARRAKLSAAMKARYAKQREEEQAYLPPEPEPGIAQRTHTLYECDQIAAQTGLVHAGWMNAGGPFVDERMNRHTWRLEYEPADAGPQVQVPVFLSAETARRLR